MTIIFPFKKIKDEYDSPKLIRENFFKIIQEIGEKYGYKTEDNKSAITIKMVDHEKSKIVHSCDFGIVEDLVDNQENEYQMILVRDKKYHITYLCME